MKKFSICLALLLAMMLCCGAQAVSNVHFVGGAEEFVFLPGNELSETDLFEGFKEVLPGDKITQTITVKNFTDSKVRIYLRAEPVTEADREFLSQMTMTVECRDEEIFNAAVSETAQLTNFSSLGAFRKNGSTDLTVTLHVSENMGNEFMGRQGIIPWTFHVEEIIPDDTPDTGDWFEMSIWISVAMILAAAVIVLIALQKKRSAEEN